MNLQPLCQVQNIECHPIPKQIRLLPYFLILNFLKGRCLHDIILRILPIIHEASLWGVSHTAPHSANRSQISGAQGPWLFIRCLHCWDHQSPKRVMVFQITLLNFRFCFLATKSPDVARVFQIACDCTNCLKKSLKDYCRTESDHYGKKSIEKLVTIKNITTLSHKHIIIFKILT